MVLASCRYVALPVRGLKICHFNGLSKLHFPFLMDINCVQRQIGIDCNCIWPPERHVRLAHPWRKVTARLSHGHGHTPHECRALQRRRKERAEAVHSSRKDLFSVSNAPQDNLGVGRVGQSEAPKSYDSNSWVMSGIMGIHHQVVRDPNYITKNIEIFLLVMQILECFVFTYTHN